ncbi:MAG: hypothetical protein K9I85_16300 [Saprospiraceae bacterium]|nr:hypothetical protein [Saprospiraceae bacterium]
MKGLLIFLVIFSISCNTILKENNQNKTLHDSEASIKEFKIVFFCNCISESFNNSTVDYLISTDGSYTHDFSLGLNNYKLLDSLAKSVAFQIERDSVEWINKISKNSTPGEFEILRMEGLVGKKTFKFCLDYYTSKELDDIAKAQFID